MPSSKKQYNLLHWDKSNKLHEVFILFSVLFFGAWGGATLSRFPKKFHDFIAGPIGTFVIVMINLVMLDDFKVSIQSFIEIVFQSIVYTILLQLVITYFNYQAMLENEVEEEDKKEIIKSEIKEELRYL